MPHHLSLVGSELRLGSRLDLARPTSADLSCLDLNSIRSRGIGVFLLAFVAEGILADIVLEVISGMVLLEEIIHVLCFFLFNSLPL